MPTGKKYTTPRRAPLTENENERVRARRTVEWGEIAHWKMEIPTKDKSRAHKTL